MIFSLLVLIFLLLYVKNTEIKNPPNFFKGLIEVIKTNRLVDFIDSKFRVLLSSRIRARYWEGCKESLLLYKSFISNCLDYDSAFNAKLYANSLINIPKLITLFLPLTVPITFINILKLSSLIYNYPFRLLTHISEYLLFPGFAVFTLVHLFLLIRLLNFPLWFKEFWLRSFDFTKKTTRKNYWHVTAINIFIGIFSSAMLFAGIFNDIPSLLIIGIIIYLIMFIPSLSIMIRRLRDIGKEPEWVVINYTGIGSLVLIIWFCRPSNYKSKNPFGL